MANFIIEDFKNSWNKKDNGLVKIILINVIFFVSMSILQVVFTLSGLSSLFVILLNKLMLPAELKTFIFQPWSLISYFFLHMNFMHILWNMLFLYWFGKIIHDNIGNNAIISLYVLGGIIGGLFYMALYNIIPYYSEMVSQSLMLGASAGVFSVVVGSATLLPNYTFYLLFLGPVRIKYIALFYVLLSFLDVSGNNAGGEIAHLGGAFIGFLYIKQLQNGINMGEGIINFINYFSSEKRKTKRKADNVSSESNRDNISQDEIDKILDKISDSGYSSLSKKEKEKLFNASKK
jgi:membrane associated rhomboid family serine protease